MRRPAPRDARPRFAGCFGRGLVVWLVIAAAEVVHGTLRALFLAPQVGDLPSRQIGVLTGSLLILLIAYLFVPWIAAATRRQLLAVGLSWVVLMATFEVAVGRLLGLSWQRIASDYLPSQGGFMLLGLAFLAVSPLLAATIRSRRDNAA